MVKGSSMVTVRFKLPAVVAWPTRRRDNASILRWLRTVPFVNNIDSSSLAQKYFHKMLSTLSRGVGLLSRTITQAVTVNSIVSPVRRLHITPVVCAEPLKKKKRMDPQILRMREQRRQRKLEKSIR